MTLAGDRYRLLGVIGKGGMAVVYRAYDSRLEVVRAIKVLHPKFGHESSVRQRFEREARTMAQISHPNLVTVTDVGWDDGRAWIVMELLTGGSLEQRVAEHGPLAPRVACQVVRGVLRALGAVHALGVVHRDIKPANILVSGSGVPKLSDFGIARIGSDSGQTRTGAILGTRDFMAPEQRSGARQVSERSDLYSVGATLYRLVAGALPTDIDNPVVQDELLQGLPEPLRPVVRRAVSYRPEDRYADASEMHDAIAAVEGDLPETPVDVAPLGVAPASTTEDAPVSEARTFAIVDSMAADELWPVAPRTPTTEAPSRRRRWVPFVAVGALAGATVVVGGLTVVGPPPAPPPAAVEVAPSPPAEPPAPVRVRPEVVEVVPEGEAPPPSPAPAPAVSPRTGEVRVTGAASKVELIGPGGIRHPQGVVPAGTYQLEATFPDRDKPVDVGPLTVPAGAVVELECFGAGYYRCVPPRR